MRLYGLKFKSATIALLFLFVIALSYNVIPAVADDVCYVYVGGEIIGFETDIGGVLVTDTNDLEVGKWNVVSSLRRGDVIRKINGTVVYYVDDVGKILCNEGVTNNSCVTVELVRNGKTIEEDVAVVFDENKNGFVLGVDVKDSLCGLGTVTYVTKTGDFCGLGHEIVDFDTGYTVNSCGGKIVEACLTGIVRGKVGAPGTIKGSLGRKRIGMVEKSGKFGIKGKVAYSFSEKSDIVRLGGKKDVLPGTATICSSVGGKKEYYDIKIIKTFPQLSAEEKSMIIKISDKRLLSLTGGIVQGMSGSPIIQNGIMVGALTHVFTNDPTMGYGVYADWQC